jgi:hypothetical protein
LNTIIKIIMKNVACSRKLLAAGESMLVERCSCGSVHVTIGAVTLRLASGAIPALAATLADAARTLVLCEAFAATAIAEDGLA